MLSKIKNIATGVVWVVVIMFVAVPAIIYMYMSTSEEEAIIKKLKSGE